MQYQVSYIKRLRVVGVTVIIVAAYVCLYVVDSTFGGYDGPVAGNWQYSFGLSASTGFIWQPRFGYADNHDSSFVGKLLLPMIRLDQRYCHRSLDLGSSNDWNLLFATNNQLHWHPDALARNERVRTTKALWRSHCIDNPDFCLQSTLDFHSSNDTHFLALLLSDSFGTNAIGRLKITEDGTREEFYKRNVRRVVAAVRAIKQDVGLTNSGAGTPKSK